MDGISVTGGRLNAGNALAAVVPPPPPPNTPPTATISEPANGNSFLTSDIISFNGSGSDNEDGSLSGGSLVWTSNIDGQIGTDESFSKVLSAGSHTVTLTATDSEGATGTDSVGITVTAPPPPSSTVLYLSLGSSGSIGGLPVANEDIIAYDGTDFTRYFDGSDVGLSSFTIDGFDVVSASEIVISFTSSGSITGISGTVDDSDLVRFTPSSLGETTSGQFELYLDGSDIGLTRSGEDIDGVNVLSDGRVLVSTRGSFSVSGLSGRDEDIAAFTPSSLGPNTSGSWSLYFDGSDVGLTSSSEDINALAVGSGGDIHLSTTGSFSVSGVSGQDEDAFVFSPTSLGSSTSGTYGSTLTIDGSVHGASGNDLYGFDIPTGPPNDPPSAHAGPDQTGDEGDVISFDGSGSSDSDGTIVAYDWNFGDGGTGTGVGPTHVYADNAAYTVTLTVTDDLGATDTATATATIGNAPPTADSGGPYSGDEGSAISFTGAATDPGSADTHTFTWDFGDSSPVSTGQSVSHAYADDGGYTVTLTVTDDDGGSDASTTTATIANVAPTAGAGGPYSGEVGDSITFTGSAADPGSADTHDFTWDFGDGSPTASGQSVAHAYGTAGSFTATLTVTDDEGASDSDSATVNIYPPNQPPVADAGPDQNLTDTDKNGSEMVTLDGSGSSDPDGSISVYEWTEGATALGTGAVLNVSLAAGTHTITLTVTDNIGASAGDTVVVDVNQPPTANAGLDQSANDADGTNSETVTLDGSASSDLDGTIDTYEWAEGATPLGSTVSITESFGVGTHTVTLTVTDDDGATDSNDVVVTVFANQTPTADPGPNQTVTDADDNGFEMVTLDGSGSSDSDGFLVTYEWIEGGSSLGSGPTITPTLAVGDHTVTLEVTDNGGATASNDVVVTVNAAPQGVAPFLQTGVVTVSSSGWTTVNLDRTYTEMVVVATPNYDDSTDPIVARVNNASGDSFQLTLNRTEGTGAVSAPVHWMVVEAGVYTVADDGVKMEAHTYNSTVTDRKGSWSGESRTYSNSYSQPVVVGQVMTSNDPNWSVFWDRSGSSAKTAPNGTLRVGKHVGEDPNTSRADETVGYVVIEEGSGTMGSTGYAANLGGDSIRGVEDSPPYSYSVSGLSSASTAIATQAAMDGGNGG